MIAKVSILFAAVVAVHANAILHGAALFNTGNSISTRHQDGHGNYAFSYGIADGKGATNSRSEVGDAAGNKKGSYTLTDIDGRARRVDYVADGLGFRTSISTNEKGTAASAPAAALINSPYAAPMAPVDLAHASIAAPTLGHYGAPIATSSVINHAAPLAVAPYGVGHLGLGLGYGVGHIGLGYGAGLLHAGLL